MLIFSTKMLNDDTTWYRSDEEVTVRGFDLVFLDEASFLVNNIQLGPIVSRSFKVKLMGLLYKKHNLFDPFYIVGTDVLS